MKISFDQENTDTGMLMEAAEIRRRYGIPFDELMRFGLEVALQSIRQGYVPSFQLNVMVAIRRCRKDSIWKLRN